VNFKKLVSLFVSSAFIASILPFPSVLADSYNIIAKNETSQIISKGVIHKNITYFTTEGWININVLNVNLTDNYTDVSTIFNPNGLKERMTVKDMANYAGAIAAVNGDFFDTKTGFPIGPTVIDGRLITDPSNTDKLAAFSINNKKMPSIDYWSKSLSIILPDGSSVPISSINKTSTSFDYLNMYTSDWSNMSPGSSDSVPDLVEVIVDRNDTVLEIRCGQPPVEIPEGGYVLDTAGYLKDILLTLQPGDIIQKNITTTPPYENLEMAVGGGTILLKNGSIYPFTHEIKGNLARTAIGYTYDKKSLIIATVDNSSTRGMSLNEMANLMLSLGAYDAINLDGGGSTQMVLRPLGDTQTILQNFAKDGYERKVANAVAIFNNAPKGNLYALKIESEDKNVFVGFHRKLTVKGYDENYNPIQINPLDIQFSVSGISGNFDGNYFIPSSTGEGSITARIGSVTGTYKITSLDKPVDIRFNPYSVYIDKNKSMQITVTAKNIKGYRALIEPEDISWEIYNNIGTIDSNNTFKSSSSDISGALVANVADKKGVLNVKVGNGSDFDNSILPKVPDFWTIDPANKDVQVKNTFDSFKFMVFGDTQYNTLLKLQLSLKAADIANKNYPLVIFTGKVNDRVLNSLNIEYITADKNMVYDYKNSTFIVLNNKGGSLLSYDKNQWSWFLTQLKNVKGNNLFVVLPQPVWGSDGFKDDKEAALFEDTLKDFKETTGKNVWIIYGSQNKFYTTLNDEIRYITNYGTDLRENKTDIYKDFGYISVMVNGKDLNYTFNNLIN